MMNLTMSGSMLHAECIAKGITNVLVYPKYTGCGCVKDIPMNKKIDYLLSCDDSRIVSYNFAVKRGKASLELIYAYHETCYLCYRNRCVYCDELDRPKGFDNKRLYHGIAAFSLCGLNEMEDYMDRVCGIMHHPEWQICCSSTAIGYIGVVVTGDVLCASNADLCSCVDSINGRRYFDASTFRASCLIMDAAELDSSVWTHDEIVTRNCKVRSIWVYMDAPEEIKDFALVIARRLNLTCVFVEKAQIVK